MRLLGVELAKAGFDEVQLALALLHELGRFHEPGVDALALGRDLLNRARPASRQEKRKCQ